MTTVTSEVFTIGHSTLSYEQFRDLLEKHSVKAIADVRSIPISRHFSHFSQRELKNRLRQDGVAYVFLGKELGGRPEIPALYSNGIADYEKMAATREFQVGICRVGDGASKYRVALMCSEQDPLDCHRCLLVARALKDRAVNVKHILPNGQLLTQNQIEDRLLEQLGKTSELFETREQTLQKAYAKRAGKVAYRADKTLPGDHVAAE